MYVECVKSLVIVIVESSMKDSDKMSIFASQTASSLSALKMIQSAQIHSQVRDGIKIIHTKNVQHT